MKDILSKTPSEFEAEVLMALFDGLAARCVRYAVLRNYQNLPTSVGARDIDIVVEPADLSASVEAVGRIANELDLIHANYYHDERLTQFTLARRLAPDLFFELKIDFFTSSQIYGVEVLSAAQMLKMTSLHNGIPIVSDEVRLLDKWLFNLILGRPLHPKYDADFAAIAIASGAIISAAIKPLFGTKTANWRVAELAAGRGSSAQPLALRHRLAALARMWLRQGFKGIGRSLRFAGFRLRDRLRPAGIFLSVSGPDGSGKTTVIDLVIAQLKQLYGEQALSYCHFRPSLLPRIASVAKASKAIDSIDENYESPHRARPSGAVGSLLRLSYYWLDYVGGYLRTVHKALVRREVVLFDRYIYDMIADPGRSRIALPAGLIRAAARLTPLPRWAFFIRVPAEIVHSRKQELTLEAIENLNARYADLTQRGMLIGIENAGTPEVAAAAIVDRIVTARDAQARRGMERLAG